MTLNCLRLTDPKYAWVVCPVEAEEVTSCVYPIQLLSSCVSVYVVKCVSRPCLSLYSLLTYALYSADCFFWQYSFKEEETTKE